MIAAARAVHSGSLRAEHVLHVDYYRAEVDGLRGIAILAVIAFHAFPTYFPGGYVGVDVFFVVSGYLISSILLRNLERSTFTFSQFYARRIRRIFPALVLVLAACLTFGAIALLPGELQELGKHIASASVFLSNFTLWQEAGYFDRASELKPLLHLWSLGIEEQFYLIWPMLLLWLWKLQPHRIVPYVLVLTLGSFAASLVIEPRSGVANFYLPFSRFWELGCGCLLAIVQHSRSRTSNDGIIPSRVSPHWHSMLAGLGIVLIALSVLLLDSNTPFPGWAALMPTLGAACVIAARPDAWLQRRILACGWLVLIGLISYPLYLWHWPLLSFATILSAGTPPALPVRLIAVAIAVVLAWLTFKYFERPIRGRRRAHDAVAVAVALAVLGVAGLAVFVARGLPERLDVDVASLTPLPRTNELCEQRFAERSTFNYCKSTSSSRSEVVILGDSRAQAVYDAIVEQGGVDLSVTLLGRGGCPPLLNVELHEPDEEGCSDAWKTFAAFVERERPSVVLLVGGGAHLLDPERAALEEGDRVFAGHAEAFKYGVRQLVASLQKTSKVIYVLQFPEFETAPSCFLRPFRLPGTQCMPTLKRADVVVRTAEYRNLVHEVQTELSGLEVVDSLETLCTQTLCSQQLASGEVIYSDKLHLSPAGGRYFVRESGLLEVLSAVPTEYAAASD
ncbi:MAG TPA: acyltransferase family protein [Steroidobacteraceae bacterium]